MLYSKLASFYFGLETTSKRLGKTHIISKFLKKINKKDVEHLSYLIRGKIFAAWDGRKIGVSSRIILKALSKATGENVNKIEKLWAKKGDLGLVAEDLIEKKKQTTLKMIQLTSQKVFNNIQKLADLEGEGTVDRKLGLIAELLTSASGLEAKYITRTILEDLRVGVAAGTFRDGIVWAFFGNELKLKYDREKHSFEVPDREKYKFYVEKVQKAYDLSNDFGLVIEKLIEKGEKGLEDVKLNISKPINVMLYQKVESINEGFKSVGKPCSCEFKYDGFRLLISKEKNIKLFTRRLENVTKQFPDIVELVKKNIKGDNFILDSEVIGKDPKTGNWLPFQAISQRIKRKYNIHEMVKKVPVMCFVFDIIAYENKSVLTKPFKERRKIIEKIILPVKEKLEAAERIITSDVLEAQEFYDKALAKGNEGIMMKNLEGIYKPGSRVGYGVKVKPILETLDLVITGAEWGEGKRAKWLSSFSLSCFNNDKTELLEIGKVGTGIKEKSELGVSFPELTKLLKPLIKETKGKSVKLKAEIVVEVAYEEIQKSTNYSSKYALRFPRLIKLRSDLGLSDTKTLREVQRIYVLQRGRNK